MANICIVCKEEFFFATQTSGKGRCKCIKDFWASDIPEQISLLPTIRLLAENGNTSAMANLVGAQRHLDQQQDVYQEWVFKAAELGDLHAVAEYIDEFLIGEIDGIHSEEQSSLFAKYCKLLDDKGLGEGDFFRFEYLDLIDEWEKSQDFLVKSANMGNKSALEKVFVDDYFELNLSQMEKIVRENLKEGRWLAASYFAGYLEESDPDSAKAWYEIAITLAGKKDKAEISRVLGDFCWRIKDYPRAISAFEKHIELTEDLEKISTKTLNNLGFSATEVNDLDKAEKYWAISASRNNSIAINSLGWLAEKRGLISAAQLWWERTAKDDDLYAIRGLIRVKLIANDSAGAEFWESRLKEIQKEE